MAEYKDNRKARESLERVLSFAQNIGKYTRQRTRFNRALETKTATRKMVLEAVDSDFDLQNELNAILARYSIVATVDSPDALRFRGRFDTNSFLCLVTGGIYPEGFREADAVLSVFQLTQQNHVSRVRLCSRKNCPRFFYAGKRNHRFCSDACRSAAWNTTLKAKEGRRRRAKKRRDQERKYRRYRAKLKSEKRQAHK
jgi:hypothetical protein